MIVKGKQTPDVEGNWLYRYMEGGDRYFTKIVYLGNDINGNPMQPYPECTNEEKEEWEEDHRPPLPEPYEIQEAEIIES